MSAALLFYECVLKRSIKGTDSPSSQSYTEVSIVLGNQTLNNNKRIDVYCMFMFIVNYILCDEQSVT